MYIHPFLAGIVFVILIELIALFAYGLFHNEK